MELEQEETQICRLCGQCESIYIDVFGEEGVRRYLGLKIHSKINILIKEDDILSKVVCLKCLATLEYVCEFIKGCQDTQTEFLKEINMRNIQPIQNNNDSDSDKENYLSGNKQKLKKRLANNVLNENFDNNVNNDSAEKKKINSDNENVSDTAITNTFKSQISSPKVLKIRQNKDKISLNPKTDKNILQYQEIIVSDSIKTEEGSSMQGENQSNTKKLISEENDMEALAYKNKTKKATIGKKIYSSKINQIFQTQLDSETSINDSCNKDNILNVITHTTNDDKEEKSSEVLIMQTCVKTETKNEQIKKTKEPKVIKNNLLDTNPLENNTSYNNCNDIDLKNLEEEVIKQLPDISTLAFKTNNNNNPLLKELNIASQSTFQKNGKITNKTDHKKTKDSSSKNNANRIYNLLTVEQKQIIERHYFTDLLTPDKTMTVNKNIIKTEDVYKCKFCQIKYIRYDKCQVHVWRHLNIKPYKCRICKFETVTISNIRIHIRKRHLKLKPYECSVCDKRYTSTILLKEHINTHTGDKPYKCDNCDYASSSRQVLKYHADSHKLEKDVICAECGKLFYSKNRLRAHMMIHMKDKIFSCKICSSYLTSEESLQAHIVNVHSRVYKCKTCDKVFKSNKALHNHQNVHSPPKYTCHICKNMYKSKHILKEHILKHKGIRKYKCKECKKTFAQQSHLAAHMAVHSDIRFHCPGCKRPFNRHDNMKIHTKRCSLFLANPELQKQIVRIERRKPKEQNTNKNISVNLSKPNTPSTSNITLHIKTDSNIENPEDVHDSYIHKNNNDYETSTETLIEKQLSTDQF